MCYGLSKGLVQRGHEVIVYTTDTLDAKNRIKAREEVIDGIKVRRFGNLSNSIAYNHNFWLSPAMLSTVRNNLKYFDIVHMHEYRTTQNVMVHHYAVKYGIPYVTQAHGALLRKAPKRSLKRLYDNLFGYRILKDAARVIALNETEVDQYEKMGIARNKINIVPNGIDLSEFENLPAKGEFRKKYGLRDDDKVVLYVGRLHQTKGLDLLVKAFAELNIDNARLVIVGPDDGYLATLTGLIEDFAIADRVLLTGPLYERSRLEAYVDADVFVTPTFYGFPVTFAEASACGLPIITTEDDPRLDWIHNQVGYVVAYDVNQLKDAVLKIITNRDLVPQFQENGRKLVRDRFNWSKIAENVEGIYLSCLPSSE